MEADDAERGKTPVSGPRRLNAFTGFAFENAPTAAAVRASGSCGASFAAASNCRSAETGRSRFQSAEPYRSFARASGFAAARASAASSAPPAASRTRAEGRSRARGTRTAGPGTQRRVQEILRLDPVRRVGGDARRPSPRRRRRRRCGRPSSRRCRGGVARRRSPGARLRGPALREPDLVPRGEGRADLCLQGVVAGEDRARPARRAWRCRAPARR